MVTVITRTIGPTGRDYATFTLAEAAVESIATAEFGSTDLVASDGAIVFEADAGTYSEHFTISNSLTCDPTRNVTYQSAAGGQAVIGDTHPFGLILVTDGAFTTLRRLAFGGTATGASGRGVEINPASGATCEGCLLDSLTFERLGGSGVGIVLNTGATSGGAGSATTPTVIQNCVELGVGQGVTISGTASDEIHVNVVNCTFAGTGLIAFGINTANDLTINSVNNINLGHSWNWRDAFTTGTVTATGSNNFGGANQPFPTAIQGSPYPITATTSFSTPLGAGDFAVYMGSNGSLANVTGNDAWQQGVGPSANASVPTTDINGVARSGASCNPGAFEADGFVAPTVTTQTIGPVGRDFATFTLAEASLPSEDITFTNRAFVFEADAGTYTTTLNANSGLTTDATRNVTYKPAAGSKHGGLAGAGVIIDTGAANRPITLEDDFTVVDGFNLATTTNYCAWLQGAGGVARNCIASPAVRGFLVYGGTAVHPVEVLNCVALGGTGHGFYNLADSSGDAHGKYVNCVGNSSGQTVYRNQQNANTSSAAYLNCLSLSSLTYDGSGGGTATGSNNFGGSGSPFPVALQGSPYPVTASTAYDPGAGDFALYVGKNGALLDSPNNDVINGGVGPASNSNVPTTDILGDTRSGTTTNPGAFALAQATAVLTRTIGPVGRDYATFIEAEADVENIGGSADLVFENERIEFVVDSATYSGLVVMSDGLTKDPTRNVTYRAAVPHGGVFGSGPILTSTTTACVYASEDYITFRDLQFQASGPSGLRFQTAGTVGNLIQNCLWDGSSTSGAILGVFIFSPFGSGTSANPHIVENCVARGSFNISADSADSHFRIRNCTNIYHPDLAGDINQRQFILYTNTGRTNSLQVLNCWTAFSRPFSSSGSGTATVTGSNNFSPNTGGGTDLPAALQGSPYPITPTTNTTPGFGDYAIYEAATGALIVVDDNAALGGGVGPAANADVPVFDINGVKRIGGGCDPGAFEGVRSRSLDVWDVVAATHTTPGSFGELLHQVYLLTRTAAGGRIV